MWNSKIGNGPESKYMKEFTSGETKRLFVKKSDGEGTDFYYMGTFEIDNIKGTTKKNNKGVLQPICDVTLKMNESIREDIFDYLQQYKYKNTLIQSNTTIQTSTYPWTASFVQSLKET